MPFMLSSVLRQCVFIFALILMFGVSSVQAEWHSDAQGIMGTEINVTLWHENTDHAKKAIASVMQEMRRIDSALSPYKPTSELARLNNSAYKSSVILSDELYVLIDKSLFFSRLSDGAFDITFASLARYYDYRKGISPSEAERKESKAAFNYKNLLLDRKTKSLKFDHEYVQIDLGGVAKGYAIDLSIEILQHFGIKHASVSAGGDSALLGDRRGRPWVVGIKHPRLVEGGSDQAVIRLPLSDTALSTSGDYERYFIDEKNGRRIHHIINPKTGHSASRVMSVSILGARGIDTDPLSTTVFILGVEKGLALVNKLQGFDAIVIDIQGKVHYSDGLAIPE